MPSGCATFGHYVIHCNIWHVAHAVLIVPVLRVTKTWAKVLAILISCLSSGSKASRLRTEYLILSNGILRFSNDSWMFRVKAVKSNSIFFVSVMSRSSNSILSSSSRLEVSRCGKLKDVGASGGGCWCGGGESCSTRLVASLVTLVTIV